MNPRPHFPKIFAANVPCRCANSGTANCRTVAPGRRIRLEAGAANSRRARQAGWEQALWEGLFRALGYKHNAWPMQNLAGTRPLSLRAARKRRCFQVRLLGIGGLLPADLTRSQKSSDTYLRRVWDCWWCERDEFADILPAAGGLEISRPAPGQSSAAAAGARGALAGRPKSDFQN